MLDKVNNFQNLDAKYTYDPIIDQLEDVYLTDTFSILKINEGNDDYITLNNVIARKVPYRTAIVIINEVEKNEKLRNGKISLDAIIRKYDDEKAGDIYGELLLMHSEKMKSFAN